MNLEVQLVQGEPSRTPPPGTPVISGALPDERERRLLDNYRTQPAQEPPVQEEAEQLLWNLG